MQFMFSVACFIQASALLSSFFVPIARQDTWLCVIFGILVSLPLMFIYLGLMRGFPGKNLIEINRIVFGRIGGALASLLFVLFTITLTSLNVRDFGQLVEMTIMAQTPPVVLIGLCLAVCTLAVYKGLRVVTHYSLAFSLLAGVILTLGALLTLNNWRLENFLPMFEQPVESYVRAAHIAITIPIGELVVFMMIMPRVKRTDKGLARYLLGGLLIGGLTIVGAVVRDTAVLGNTVTLYALPSFETLRLARLAEGLSRLEILFAIVLIVLLFFKILVLYYVSVSALAQLLRLRSYHPLVLVVGALFIVYSVFVYRSSVTHAAGGQEHTAALWTLFEFILPLLTLVIAWIRKLPQKNPTEKEGV